MLDIVNDIKKIKRDINDVMSEINYTFEKGYSKFIGNIKNPRCDIIHTQKNIKIDLSLPGVNEKDILLKIKHNGIEVDAKIKDKEKTLGYHRLISIPSTVNSDNIKTRFSKNTLTIILPRKKEKN